MRADENRMFGMSKDDIQEQFINSLTARLSGLEMVVAGILSDCQELIAMKESAGTNPDELIRKQLNVAKFILFEMMDKQRSDA